MSEKPIIFSGPLVRAIMEGRKTQTRRVVNLYDGNHADKAGCFRRAYPHEGAGWMQYGAGGAWVPVRPPYAPGDTLWVREAWHRDLDHDRIFYRADQDADGLIPYEMRGEGGWGGGVGTARISRWRSPIHMPRRASRLTLRVTAVRVEWLQEISGEDARAEGTTVPRCTCETCVRTSAICPADQSAYIETFASGWDAINGKRGPWASNPWVWVVTFEKADEQPRIKT